MSTLTFTRLILGNVCVKAEGMMKLMKFLVLIQHCVERILLKNKLVIPNCQPLLLGEDYIELKLWQLKKTSFETEHLSQPFDSKS